MTDVAGTYGLLAAALQGTAALPRAACRGHAPMFDPDHDEAAALALCHQCPVLRTCRQWFDDLTPRERPAGVVAGLIHHRDSTNRRSTITTP